MEIARSSFENTKQSIRDRTGVVIATKQLEDMVSEMATDFDCFYATRSKQAVADLAAIRGSPRALAPSASTARRSWFSRPTGRASRDAKKAKPQAQSPAEQDPTGGANTDDNAEAG